MIECNDLQDKDRGLPSLRWLLYTGAGEVGLICNPTPDGHYYVGHVSLTVSGRTCQAWSSQSPHTHTYSQDSQFADVTVAAASNYCRNPSSNDGPWCYTTDPAVRWENCDLPDCGQSSAARFTKYLTTILRLKMK